MCKPVNLPISVILIFVYIDKNVINGADFGIKRPNT